MRRLLPVAAAAFAAVAGIVGCGHGNGAANRATVPLTQVSQRYQAAVEPAQAAQSAVVTGALSFSGGSPVQLQAAARKSRPAIEGAAHKVAAIVAPQPIQRDITDVAAAMDAIATDLNTLAAAAAGNAIQSDIARLVADAGREAAADALVKLALNVALSPTTLPPLIVPPPPTSTIPAPTTTAAGKHTTTTKAHTSTTVAHTTATTRPRTTTTVHP